MRSASDAAISDIAGTLLMVGAVVLAGGALTALVSANLSAPTPPAVSFALAPLAPGDAEVGIVLRSGADLPLDKLEILLAREGSSPLPVARGDWDAPHASSWRAGDRLALPLDPPAGASERVEVRVVLTEANAQLGVLSARTGSGAPPLPDPTLVAELAPRSLLADGVSAALLTVRVQHPLGAGSIARVEADLSNLTNASSTANATLRLGDAGQEGDALGGDGVWSALLRAPALASPGTYDLSVQATDLSGRLAGRAVVNVTITGNLSLLVGGGGAGGGGAGSVTNGTCYGCVVVGGVSSYEGTRLQVPAPQNVTSFHLRNWTYDRMNPQRLVDDALVIRVVNATHGWSAYFTFGHVDGVACITGAQMWSTTKSTVYAPKNGTCLPLDKLDLNMTDPVAAQQLVRVSGAAHPEATYARSGLTGPVTFIVAYMRDEDPTSQKELALAIGMYSVDVVMT